MNLDISLTLKNVQNIFVLEITGEIDIFTCPKLEEALAKTQDKGKQDLLVNLRGVTYIDSTGIGVLAKWANEIVSAKNNFAIITNSLRIKKIIEVSGVKKKIVFNVFDTEEQAIKAIKG